MTAIAKECHVKKGMIMLFTTHSQYAGVLSIVFGSNHRVTTLLHQITSVKSTRYPVMNLNQIQERYYEKKKYNPQGHSSPKTVTPT